jgi:hypothetical protein
VNPVKVYLGRLDWINGAAIYEFPTLQAARTFEAFHRRRDPHRDILVVDQP